MKKLYTWGGTMYIGYVYMSERHKIGLKIGLKRHKFMFLCLYFYVFMFLGKLHCRPLGLDPYLQGVEYTQRVRALTGFAGRVRRGAYGRGKRVQAGTVIGAITFVGQEITLACGENPTKLAWSDKCLPWLQQMYDGWRKEDPATTKQLPVEADVPELLADRGLRASATERDRAVGDLTLIAFYYLLWIGEYTIKGNRNETKQTVTSNGRT